MLEHASWGWLPHKLAFTLAGIGNVFAWAQSAVTNNINAGAIVTFCTVAIPTIGAAVIYLTRIVWPPISDAIFAYKERRARFETNTLAGRMDQLTAELAQERQGRAAAADLAKVQAEIAAGARTIAEQNGEHVKALSALVETLTAKLDEANHGIALANEQAEKARVTLHNIRAEAHGALQNANADKLELQLKLDRANAELQEANEKLSVLTVKVDEGIIGTAALACQNSARLDQVEKSVSGDNLVGPGSTDDYLPTQPQS